MWLLCPDDTTEWMVVTKNAHGEVTTAKCQADTKGERGAEEQEPLVSACPGQAILVLDRLPITGNSSTSESGALFVIVSTYRE